MKLSPNSVEERKTISWSLLMGAGLLIADQATKIWVERSFKLYESMPIIDGFFSFTHVRNLGAAWSILSGYGWLLLIIGLLVIMGVIKYFRYLSEGYVERYYGLLAILSGVLGNSIDRLWRGAVVDFIDVHYYNIWNYPIFNVADMAICCGIGVFVLSNMLRKSKQEKDENPEH